MRTWTIGRRFGVMVVLMGVLADGGVALTAESDVMGAAQLADHDTLVARQSVRDVAKVRG